MTWLRVLELVARIALIDPTLPAAEARQHAMAAAIAETDEVPAELLLAVARTESSFDPSWVSRLEDGRRKTGRWRARRPAGSGNRFCGPLQTAAGSSWSTCLTHRILVVGYVVGAGELGAWIARGRGDVRRALCGFAGGNRAFAARSCSTYASRVINRAVTMGLPKPSRNQRIKDRRLALLRLLSPGLICARCRVAGLPPHLLEIDHVDGRPEYASNRINSMARVERYELELEAGVHLRVLCQYCNKVAGGDRRYTPDERRARRA